MPCLRLSQGLFWDKGRELLTTRLQLLLSTPFRQSAFSLLKSLFCPCGGHLKSVFLPRLCRGKIFLFVNSVRAGQMFCRKSPNGFFLTVWGIAGRCLQSVAMSVLLSIPQSQQRIFCKIRRILYKKYTFQEEFRHFRNHPLTFYTISANISLGNGFMRQTSERQVGRFFNWKRLIISNIAMCHL